MWSFKLTKEPISEGKKFLYARLIVSIRTHEKIRRIAKKRNVSMKYLANKIVLAGLKALEL